jgi:NTE family protein
MQNNIEQKQSYSLVLSGGGALSISFIGIIEQLENNSNKIKIDELIGTSMGSIIAACLSIGLTSKEIIVLLNSFSNIFNWTKLSFDGNSIIKIDKIKKILIDIFTENRKIKNTLIPLKIITTNMKDGTVKVFDKDDDITIVQALLASMAIPGVFEEQIIDNEVYCDGFLIENLGILQSSIKNVIALDSLGLNSYNNELPNHFLKTKNVFNMIEKSMRLLIINQTKQLIKEFENLKETKNREKKLIYIDLDTKKFKTASFHKVNELIEIGRKINIDKYL